jgi:hypothetical protein
MWVHAWHTQTQLQAAAKNEKNQRNQQQSKRGILMSPFALRRLLLSLLPRASRSSTPHSFRSFRRMHPPAAPPPLPSVACLSPSSPSFLFPSAASLSCVCRYYLLLPGAKRFCRSSSSSSSSFPLFPNARVGGATHEARTQHARNLARARRPLSLCVCLSVSLLRCGGAYTGLVSLPHPLCLLLFPLRSSPTPT